MTCAIGLPSGLRPLGRVFPHSVGPLRPYDKARQSQASIFELLK